MKEIKHELIKEYLNEVGFQLENFDIKETPLEKGYFLTDKNNNTMMIVEPWFTNNLIRIDIGEKTEQYIKKLGPDNKYHFYTYIEKGEEYL